MSITVKQSSQYDGNDWWEWSVWIDAPTPELAAVARVIYTLHPTFAEPVRTVRTRENGFRLDASGWGGFEIYIEVVGTDGTSRKLTHELSLEYPDSDEVVPLKPPPKRSLDSREGEAREQAGRKSAGPIPAFEAPTAPPPAARTAPAPAPGPAPRTAPTDPPASAAARHTVYLSSGAADAGFTRKLTQRLADGGVRVTSADDVNPGMPWEDCYKLGIRNADTAVFVVSGRPTLFSKMEMEYAHGAGHAHVIPVLVGQNVTMPASLSGSVAVKVDSANEVEAAANQILAATLR